VGPSLTLTAGTTSTSTNTGALVVQGGVGIWNNLYVGGTTSTFAGNVGVGTTSPTTKLTIYDNSAGAIVTAIGDGTGANFRASRYSNDALGANNAVFKYRGTFASPLAVASGDGAGQFNFNVWGGTNTRGVGQVAGFVDTYVSDTDISGYLILGTSPPGSAGTVERMRIHASGGVSIGNTTDPGATHLSVSGGTTATIFTARNSNAAISNLFTSTIAPTTDQVIISNSGFPAVTAGVSNLQMYYVGGSAAIEASAARIDLTPGTTPGGTWNGFRTVVGTDATTSVILNGIKMDTISSPGAGTSNAVYVGTGWDNILSYNSTGVISGTGAVTALGGANATSTGSAAALVVQGGAAVWNNMYVGGNFTATGAVYAYGVWQVSTGSGGSFSSTDDTTTAATYYPLFATTAGGTAAKTASTKLQFNPSTGQLSATLINTLSDQRLKTNITTVTNATNTINLLEGVAFNWLESGAASYGVIAQAIEKIIPELVNTNELDQKTVNYNGIIAFLINAVKELDQRVKNLESR
jgi:hypothetical protein